MGLERLNDFLAAGGGALRVARQGGVGVGHVLVIHVIDRWVEDNVLDDQRDPRGAADELRARRSALMTDLLVLPAHRRQGIGRILVGDALAVARAAGAAELALFVAADNAPARRLYEEEGFHLRCILGSQLLYVHALSSTMTGA